MSSKSDSGHGPRYTGYVPPKKVKSYADDKGRQYIEMTAQDGRKFTVQLNTRNKKESSP